jgi:hypothetical protein
MAAQPATSLGDGATGVAAGAPAAQPWARTRGARRRRAVRSTTTGARFDPLLTFEAWRDLGAKLGLYSNATAWWIGDWLAFGQVKYGRRYKEAISATGLDYQTLRNYAVVARRFEMSRRRDDLTFQHHAELAALSDDAQEYWLERAADGRWSRNELRRQLRAAAGRAPVTAATLRLDVAHAQVDHWKQAAVRTQCRFEAWIVRVLDQAASAALSDACDR